MKMLIMTTILATCLASTFAEEESKGKPESAWLTVDLLQGWIRDMGYSIQSVQEGKVVAQLQPPAKNLIVVQFSDNDSIKLVTSWDSDQKGLGDGPIVNTFVFFIFIYVFFLYFKKNDDITQYTQQTQQTVGTTNVDSVKYRLMKKTLDL